MQIRSLLFILFCLAAISSQAQDRHFSQFFASPINLNPALTGAINGTYRVAANYRDQWRGVFDNPIVTYSTALDSRFNVDLGTQTKDAFGVGLLFFSDKVNGIDFSTNQIMLSAAFHKNLGIKSNQYLSIGVQGGIAQRNVNYERLNFEDQFDGLDQYVGNSLEDLPPNNFSFGDLNVGINYTTKLSKTASIFVGASLHHVFNPRISFYYDKENNPDADERLYRKYSAQLSAQLKLSEKLDLIPRVLFANQGPHLRINAGSNLRIKLNNYSSTALQIGAWARPVRTETNPIELDAIVTMVGIELSGVLIGFSYDASIGDLGTYKQGQNSFELSVSYIGSFESDDIMCPSF